MQICIPAYNGTQGYFNQHKPPYLLMTQCRRQPRFIHYILVAYRDQRLEMKAAKYPQTSRNRYNRYTSRISLQETWRTELPEGQHPPADRA